MAEKHILIDYTNLLHKYRDQNAKEVREYFEQAKQLDPNFESRAKKLHLLFQGVPEPVELATAAAARG